MAGHAQLKFVMTECSKTQIRLTGLICYIHGNNTVLNLCASCILLFILTKKTNNRFSFRVSYISLEPACLLLSGSLVTLLVT